MIVPTPPMDAAHAIPSIRPVPYFDLSGFAPSVERIPRPSGSIMAAVAVFETHMEMKAVTVMIARRMPPALPAMRPRERSPECQPAVDPPFPKSARQQKTAEEKKNDGLA